MDIHRCRFVPYVPHAINAVAFSHPSSPHAKDKGPSALRLAIGRANGDLELWNPLKGQWVQETIFRGGKDRSIEGLAWTHDPKETDERGNKHTGRLRLFSHGYSATITEWDLERARPARHAHGDSGEIWCIASQPRWQGSDNANESEFKGQHLAAGCADGSIVIFSTADGDLIFKKTLTRPSTKRARVLSIVFQDRNIIVAGYADSTIRVFDIRNGQLLRNVSLGSGPKGKKADILVWSVQTLPDGTIVSGDSSGEIRFWDATNYSLFQRIHSHKADVLDIVASADGERLMSGGADARTVVYQLKSGKKGDKQRRWTEMSHRRFHTHDVKTMAVFETKLMSIVASGGLDTAPMILPFREFDSENHRGLSNLPQVPQTSSSPSSRLVMSWWDREVHIWHFPKDHQSSDGIPVNEEIQKQLSKIYIQGEENITSASISKMGDFLTISTGSEVRLFSLRLDQSADGMKLKIRRLDLPKQIAGAGARLVQVSPDSRWLLIVQAHNVVYMLRVVGSPLRHERPRVLAKSLRLTRLSRQERDKPYHGILGSYERTIHCTTFSDDSRIIAASDLAGYVDTWVLEGHEDLTQENAMNGTLKGRLTSASSSSEEDSSEDENRNVILGQRWLRNPAGVLLPRLNALPLFLSFRPESASSSKGQVNGTVGIHPTRNNPTPRSHDLPVGEDRLLALTAENHLFEFHVLRGELSDWSRRNPNQMLPSKYADIRDRALGCVWSVENQQERLWVYGHAFLCMFNLAQDFQSAMSASTQGMRLKRKRENDIGVNSRKHESGAGNKMSQLERKSFGRSFRKSTGPDLDSGQIVSSGRKPSLESDDEEGQVGDSTLMGLRRGEGLEGGKTGVHASNVSGGDESRPNGLSVTKYGSTTCWTTHRYRYILGLLPLTGQSTSEEAVERGSEPSRLEVCLIERPTWDLALPPRYDGDQDWDA